MKSPDLLSPVRHLQWALLSLNLTMAPGLQAATEAFPDIRFGPYVFNEIQAAASPTGNDRILPYGAYRLQFGWIEPIALNGDSYMACTFLETDVHFDASPYQTDIGTTFSVKPFRLFEFGLTYNRLLFNSTMVGFNSVNGDLPPTMNWSAGKILSRQPGEANGADVFTFTSALHLRMAPFRLYVGASRALWDVDVKDRDLVYEYESDLLIKRRDRIHKITGELHLDLPSQAWLKPFTLQAVFVQDRFWNTVQTELNKNLIALGFAGFRYGKNSYAQKRGLDFSIGYFTHSPQLNRESIAHRLYLAADWKWTVDFLSAQRF